MQHVSLNDPNTDLRNLVQQLGPGDELVLFDGDRAVAKVLSLSNRPSSRQEAWDALIAMLETQTVSHLGTFDRKGLYLDDPA